MNFRNLLEERGKVAASKGILKTWSTDRWENVVSLTRKMKYVTNNKADRSHR